MRPHLDMLEALPVPAAYLEEGCLHPNARLLTLTGISAEEFAAPETWLRALFNHRADAIRLQHESDREMGFPAPRTCSLMTRDGREIPVEWSTAAYDAGELWVFHILRGPKELPVASYGMTQEEVGDMLYWVDVDGFIRSVNSAACEAMGYSPEELLTKNVSDLDPNYTQIDWRTLWEWLKKKKRARFETRHRKKNGDIMHVDILSQFAILGGVEYACSTVRDITEAKQRSEQLQQDLQARESLLANLVGMAYRCKHDADWTFEYVSDGAHQLTGYTREQFAMVPLTFAQLIHPDDLAHVNEVCTRGTEARKSFSIEYRILCSDGAVKWVLDLAQGVYDANGANVAVEGFITDITSRRRAEEALRESQALFSSFMDNNPAIAYLKDEDGRLLYVNSTFIKTVWGGAAPEWQGKFDDELWPPEAAAAFRRNDLEVLERDRSIQFDETLERGGVAEHFLSIKFPLRTADGKRFLAGLSLNTTEKRSADDARRRIEEQMLHMQKLESLGVLAGGIAHDFNNLLTGIMGYADLAQFDVPEESSAAQSIAQIRKASRRAADLTRQMLAYSGKGKFVVQPFGTFQLLREMGGLLELAISKRVALVYDLAEHLPNIEGDLTQVRQIVMNLIINASEAIGENDGVIRMTTGVRHCSREMLRTAYLDENLPPGDYVYIEVADTGCGMDEETRARLFDPFFTTKFAGRGLGMAAVLGIVRGHRAAITVERDRKSVV